MKRPLVTERSLVTVGIAILCVVAVLYFDSTAFRPQWGSLAFVALEFLGGLVLGDCAWNKWTQDWRRSLASWRAHNIVALNGDQ
jgi:hypothetical protein